MTTQTYNVQEAKANLPRLLEEVASGAEVIIAEDFDAPLPDEMLSEFEGRGG
jgi:hypothetical protein